MSTAAETLAKLEIHLACTVQPFLDSLQTIADAFTELGLKLAANLSPSLTAFGHSLHAPAPYRVKRGRGQRRNRRNPRRS